MAGRKENPQPEELDRKHLNHLRKLDAKANHHLEYNDLKEKLPNFFNELRTRRLGREIEATIFDPDDEDRIVAREKVGYTLPSQTDEKGRVTQSVAILKNGLILVMEPLAPTERSHKNFQQFSPNSYPLEIDLPHDRRSEIMNDIDYRLQDEGKVLMRSDHQGDADQALDALDNATVFAWNLQKSKEREVAKTAKGAVTIFERFIRAFDTEPLDPPKDVPPTQEQPPAK